jgi:enolase
MGEIKNVHARQILDSRGVPTIEVEVTTFKGSIGRASVPSGASLGKYEAHELRDGQDAGDGKDGGYKLAGKGVTKAIYNVNHIIKNKILGCSVFKQAEIDQIMIGLDNTSNKSFLGANAILAVSLATLQAAANEQSIPLYRHIHNTCSYDMPIPMINLINGGMHADNNLDFQEFMVMPVNAHSFRQALEMALEIFYALKKIFKEQGLSTNVGDEGGFAPQLASNEQAIELILLATEKAGLVPGKDMFIAIDAAASVFYDVNDKTYTIGNKKLSSHDMVTLWQKLTKDYPIISIEDGMAEDDWQGWASLTATLGDKIQLVGDDLFVSNINRLELGLSRKAANSILVKVNQIGTFTETVEVIKHAQKNQYNTIISHRSGETENTIIADLAVALSQQIKTGGLSRSERIAKYNQILRIEEELADSASFAKFSKFL